MCLQPVIFFPVIRGDINSRNKTSIDFLLDGLFLIGGAGAGIQPGPVTRSITGHSDGLYTEVKCTDIKSLNDACVFLINYCLPQKVECLLRFSDMNKDTHISVDVMGGTDLSNK